MHVRGSVGRRICGSGGGGARTRNASGAEFQFEASGWAVAPGLLRSERAPLRATRSAPLSYAIAAQCDDMRRAGAADGVDRIDLG